MKANGAVAWRHALVSQQSAVIAAFVALAIALFAAAMSSQMNYDEEQYVAGAYFARDLALYRDFIAFQPPPYTWITAAIFDVFDGWYVLVARVVTFILAFGACVLLFSLLRSVGTGSVAAFVLVLAFATSPFMRGPLVETRNDIMPLFFFLVGLRLYVGSEGGISEGKHRLLWSGFFFSLAAATKYSYLFAAPTSVVALLYDEYVRREGKLAFTGPRVLWLILGCSIGVLPLVYALAVYQDRFVFMTLQFHMTTVFDTYRSYGLAEMLTLEFKLKALARQLARLGNASIALVFAASVMALLFGKSSLSWRTRLAEPITIAFIGLALGALIVAIKVGPFSMYYAPVAALGALLAGRVYAWARSSVPPIVLAAILIIGLLPAVPEFRRYGDFVARGTDPENWTGVQTHRSAVRVSGILAEHSVSGHVATLFPSVVLDANPVRPEFSAGPFFFRSADLYPADRVAQLHGVGPATLDNLFASDPPAAVVAGFGRFRYFNDMDAALIDYARRHGYINVSMDWRIRGYRNGQIWVRPAHR